MKISISPYIYDGTAIVSLTWWKTFYIVLKRRVVKFILVTQHCETAIMNNLMGRVLPLLAPYEKITQ